MDQSPPKESRPAINLRIKFRSESLDQFIERYAVDVSRGGIFIRTRDPLAVGTPLKLDFQFQNGSSLMSGDGTVVWIREVDPNRTSVPPGMGVRFDKLTPESQTVLEQLLVEKAKRERGGVPGSGGQGAGGIAVRRPSSMFSVLEPQVTSSTAGRSASAPAPTPASAAAPASGTEPAPTAAPGAYRPLGTARNPFAGISVTAAPPAAAPAATPPASSDVALPTRPTGSRISQRLTPTEAAAPFDDMNDEPTQIASKLPSFLTSDEEATTVAPLALADVVREAPQKAPEPRRLPGSVGAKTPLPERKTGTQAATPIAGAPARWKQSLDHAPPTGAESTPAPVPAPAKDPTKDPTKSPSRDTARDLATAGAGPDATEKTPPPVVAPGAPEVHAPRLSAGAVIAAASVPSVATRATPTGARGAPMASPARAATSHSANVQPVKKRSSAALVGVTVIVLGAASIFVFRFFGSRATEPVSPSSAPSVVATAEPATGEPAVPAPEPTNVPPTPSPVGAANDPAGAPAASAPAATPEPTAVSPTPAPSEPPTQPPTVKKSGVGAGAATDKTANPPSGAAAPTPTAETKTIEPAISGQKAGKPKSARASKDTGAIANAPASAGTEPKPGQSAAAAAAAPPAEPATGEADAVAHQIRITSKPAGADVALDGQTIGKTPYSIGIADVSAPHFIAVRKDGFEPFEQMISASSMWTKAKAGKGKAAVNVLKINAKLKQTGGASVGGAAGPAGASAGGEAKPGTEPPAAEGDAASKVEVVRPDRPLPPSDDRAPAESPP